MSSTDPKVLTLIFKNGKFFNPADKHYGRMATVSCDRCYTDPLDIAVGYDLCLTCQNAVTGKIHDQNSKNYRKVTPTKCFNCKSKQTEMFRYDMCVECVQEMNSTTKKIGRGSILTLMEQGQFNLTTPENIYDPSGVYRGPVTTAMEQDQFRREPRIMTLMEQDQFRPAPVAMMEQDQFRTNSRMVAKMMQRQIRKSKKDSDSDENLTYMMQSQLRTNSRSKDDDTCKMS
jgi:hypothetical protein